MSTLTDFINTLSEINDSSQSTNTDTNENPYNALTRKPAFNKPKKKVIQSQLTFDRLSNGQIRLKRLNTNGSAKSWTETFSAEQLLQFSHAIRTALGSYAKLQEVKQVNLNPVFASDYATDKQKTKSYTEQFEILLDFTEGKNIWGNNQIQNYLISKGFKQSDDITITIRNKIAEVLNMLDLSSDKGLNPKPLTLYQKKLTRRINR